MPMLFELRIFQKQPHVFERRRGRRAGELVLFSRVDVETPQTGALRDRGGVRGGGHSPFFLRRGV